MNHNVCRPEIGLIYKTKFGNYLRLESQSGILFNFILVTKENVPILEKRNRSGHVVIRNKVSYTVEIISSFKKQKKICQK